MVQYGSYPDAHQDLTLGRIDYTISTIINLRSLVKDKPDVFELGVAVSSRTVPAWTLKKGSEQELFLQTR